MKNRFENFVFKYDFRSPKMKDSCRIHLVPEFLTKCNIMLQFCKSTNSGKTIYLFCILFAFICLQNSSMHPVGRGGGGKCGTPMSGCAYGRECDDELHTRPGLSDYSY